MDDRFLEDNYLSSELRVPITLLGINACSPLATNAIAGNVWDNFSSQSYKQLPSAGTIKVRHPFTGAEYDYPLPAGGRGFIRPFLQNNTVGRFEVQPDVASRMRSFQDSIEQMLWPERRPKDALFANENGPGVGIIDRITVDSYLDVAEGYIPDYLMPLVGVARKLFPFVMGSSYSIHGSELPPAERDEHRRKILALIGRT